MKLLNEIWAFRFLSVLSDGSTYSGVLKQDIASVRFVHHGLPVTTFVDIGHFHKADANNNLPAIESAYKKTFFFSFKSGNESEN